MSKSSSSAHINMQHGNPNEPLIDGHSGSFFYKTFVSICKHFELSFCQISHEKMDISLVYGQEDSRENLSIIRQFNASPDVGKLTIKAIFLQENYKTINLFFSMLSDIFQSVFSDTTTSSSEPALTNPSPFFVEHLPILRKIARSTAPVLISGDSGTGKEYLSQLIHSLGRNQLPFVIISLAGIPDTLFELELFGYEKGAFTDATEKKDGKFLLAQNGTLVLDNLETVSLFQQAKLLRVLQDGSYYPIGASQPTQIRCRIIALTSLRIEDLISKGLFREDLYYRLNVIPFHIPPLRDRRQDIEFFLSEFKKNASKSSNQPITISLGFHSYIQENDWPGNVRQLINFLEYARINSPNEILEMSRKESQLNQQKTLKDAINLCKKSLIHDTLARCNGNQTHAAKILGIQRTYLAKLIKDFSEKA